MALKEQLEGIDQEESAEERSAAEQQMLAELATAQQQVGAAGWQVASPACLLVCAGAGAVGMSLLRWCLTWWAAEQAQRTVGHVFQGTAHPFALHSRPATVQLAAAESRLGDVRTRMGSAGADAVTLKRREAAVRAERGELMKRAAEKEEQVR